MVTIASNPLDINQFWEKTPTALKYFLVISLVIITAYYLFSKTATISRVKELDKIEESINITYDLIGQFQEFEQTQYAYNVQTLTYLQNIYTLVEELNENTNKKFELLLQSGGSSSAQILEKIMMLNESFEKLQEAYSPKENEITVPEIPETKIIVNKITR
jgi:hypothetical protein